MPYRGNTRAWIRIAGVVVCSLAAVSCSRSREPSDAAAADGGDTGGKGGKGGASAEAGSGAGQPAVAGKGSGGKGDGGAGSGGSPAPGSVIAVEGGFCCIPSEKPGCCMTYGGFSTEGKSGCGDACDGMPIPSEAWKLETDEHGCKHWVEPREWTDCCGCAPNPRACNADGTWRIEFEDAGSCGLLTQTITIASDDDAGTAEVSFEGRGAHDWNCGSSTPNLKYEATVSASPNGCVVTLGSHESWCSGGEPQCEDLDLKLYLKAFSDTGEVEGTFRRCWCGSSGPEGTKVELKGIARPVP